MEVAIGPATSLSQVWETVVAATSGSRSLRPATCARGTVPKAGSTHDSYDDTIEWETRYEQRES